LRAYADSRKKVGKGMENMCWIALPLHLCTIHAIFLQSFGKSAFQ
jgi:hypothetical protein